MCGEHNGNIVKLQIYFLGAIWRVCQLGSCTQFDFEIYTDLASLLIRHLGSFKLCSGVNFLLFITYKLERVYG
jgi:hypothetical protein